MARLPLDLYAEVETATGARFKWDANQPPGSRLWNFSFRSKVGEGFSDAAGQLARRIDQDYPDLNLINTVTVRGADGTIAYEGRMSAMPRDLSDTHSIGVTLTGWMAHAKDKKFQEIFVDRQTSAWVEMPFNRRVNTVSLTHGELTWTAIQGGHVANFPATAMTSQVLAELWYTAPHGLTIGKLQYVGDGTGTLTGWAERFQAGDADSGAGGDLYAQTFNNAVQTATISPARRYLWEQLYANGSATTPAAGTNRRISKLAVFGSHGLETHEGETGEPHGVYASDVMRNIVTRFCPQLDPSGIQDTTYVIQHCAFAERTFPFDAFLEVNKYHLWHLGVWENRRLDFRPYDFTDYDWEIRTDDPGTTFSPQGPSTEDLFNGIVVTYQDLLTGSTNVVTPDDDDSLRDASSTNPWNQHGIDHWDEIQLSTPTLEASAVQLARAALSQKNRPKTPGTITVKAYIRDRAGNYQPCWKVRGGDLIAATNFPNDEPRLIHEATYNDEDKTVTLAIDAPAASLDAYMDRVGNAAGARGLT